MLPTFSWLYGHKGNGNNEYEVLQTSLKAHMEEHPLKGIMNHRSHINVCLFCSLFYGTQPNKKINKAKHWMFLRNALARTQCRVFNIDP